MRALEDYIFDIESWTVSETGDGLAVFSLTSQGTGTCGVTSSQQGLPLTTLTVAAAGSWSPVGANPLPLLAVSATRDGWRPGWGNPALPLPEVAGQASPALRVQLMLPALFYAAKAGSAGGISLPEPVLATDTGSRSDLSLPVPAPCGLSACNRQGALASPLPVPTVAAWSCSLDDPIGNGTDAATIVGLLCLGNPDLAKAALALAAGASLATVGADGLAGILLAAVADNLTYAADSDGDVWTCALGTYYRGNGDCEDGALLLHGLLLAAGIPADRLITTFGRVGTDRQGHAWLTYRRERDGSWVVLDWTSGTPATAVTSFTPIVDLPSYAMVDYALTSQSFFAVRQTPAKFFNSVAAVSLALTTPTLEAGASLGTTGTCAWASGWLRGSGRTGCRGKTILGAAVVTGRTKRSGGAGILPAAVLQALAGATGRITPAAPSVCGRTFGVWGKGRLCPTCLTVKALALQIGRNDGVLTLGRASLAGTGLGGLGGLATATFPCPLLGAKAWPGCLAPGAIRLPDLAASGSGDPSDPGNLCVMVPSLLTAADAAQADDGRLAHFRWQHATLEAW